MYLFVPDLFDLAKRTDDPSQFQAELNRLVAHKLLLLAKRLTAVGKNTEADQAVKRPALDPAAAQTQMRTTNSP